MREGLSRLAFYFGKDFPVKDALDVLNEVFGIGGGSPGVEAAASKGKTFETWGDGSRCLTYNAHENVWYVSSLRGVKHLEVIDVETMIKRKRKELEEWSYL